LRGLAGCELSLDPGRGRAERLYARVLGAPANGLRIRLRHVLPATEGDYGTILDAGSGSGVFSFELAKQHPRAKVLGIELEEQLVQRANEIARRAGLTNCRFEAGDVTQLDFDGEFDLVVSVDNLEHVEDDVAALKRLWRALRPGGTLVAHVPAYERRWLLFGRRVNFDVPGHVRPGYRADELAEKLSSAGFEIARQRYTYGPTETLTNNISYLITGADQRRKGLYAIAFPALLGVSYLGKFSSPRWGAGVLTTARRPADTDGRSA
jgi:2-polyprenyl-3-methyl-5-hydroxy-6-metoxy-1,4-benzoquinol methylase